VAEKDRHGLPHDVFGLGGCQFALVTSAARNYIAELGRRGVLNIKNPELLPGLDRLTPRTAAID
jgi:hypothetical protein